MAVAAAESAWLKSGEKEDERQRVTVRIRSIHIFSAIEHDGVAYAFIHGRELIVASVGSRYLQKKKKKKNDWSLETRNEK